jgi:hypothetical protein
MPRTSIRHRGAQARAGGSSCTPRPPVSSQSISCTWTPCSSGDCIFCLGKIADGATALGIVIALGVLAMPVGVIRSETARDLRTLTATGASTTTRRMITAATAAALGLLGAVLGMTDAVVAGLAWRTVTCPPCSATCS